MATGRNGNCYICGAEFGKTAMKNHILKAHGSDDGGQECLLLKIEGAYDKDYWLFIDVASDKTLSHVDAFLRKIWLECCGHMSAFFASGRREIGKSRKLSSFSAGDKLIHEYDFGSTTETLITVIGNTIRIPQRTAVRVLARNTPPQFECAGCGAPAEYIDAMHVYDSDNPFCCAKCAKESEDEEMLLPVTNSPRMGECGYCGELDTFTFVKPAEK